MYFDLHSDLDTPASAGDGALDWMAVGHMLAIEGTEPDLASAIGQSPLLSPDQVHLFGHSMRHSTRFERAEVDRPGLARTAVEDVTEDPVAAARRTLQQVTSRFDRYVVHLDVDVVGFTDAPLSEHPSRNTGLKLDDMLIALKVLTSVPGLTAITLAELNPHSAAYDEGLLERFATSLAGAISHVPTK